MLHQQPASTPGLSAVDPRHSDSVATQAALLLILLASAYLAGLLSLFIGRLIGHGPILWIPTAIFMAAFFLLPARLAWIGLLLGIVPHAVAVFTSGAVRLPLLALYGPMALQVAVGAVLLRYTRLRPGLTGFRESLAYLGGIAAIPSLIAAVPAAVVLTQSQGVPGFWQAALEYLVSAMAVQIVITPAIIAISPHDVPPLPLTPPTSWWELGGLSLAVVGVVEAVFGLGYQGLADVPVILYAPLGVLLWAAVRVGPRGAVFAMLATSLIAGVNTLAGHGPFATGHASASAHTLQFSLLLMAVPALLISTLTLERKRSARALDESRARLQMLVDHAPYGAFAFSLGAGDDLLLIGANRSASRILNVDCRQFIGKTLDQAFPALASTPIPDAYRRVALTGQSYDHEHFIYDEQGISGVYDIHVVQTAPREVAVFFRDITERRRAELQKTALEQQLQHSQKMESLGKLAGGMAHDFNNLLTVISGFAELAMSQADATSPVQAPLREVISASDRARELTRRILAFSRKQVLEMRVVNLNSELHNWQRMLGRMIGDDIQVVLELAPGLPGVSIDPLQIQHVLFNLAVNARDAMPSGGKITIRTAALEAAPSVPDLKPGPCVLMAFTDTGAGMDEQTLAHIFEPFFSTKAAGKGTGLGLATAFGIIKQHGGHMDASSAPGNGTTIRIYLPRSSEPAAAQPLPAVTMSRTDAPATILLVEDEPMIRDLVGNLLRDEGYDVLIAGDAAEAMAVFQRHGEEIDLLLSDLVMPGMNGVELRDRLRERRPELKAVYMSGYADTPNGNITIPPGALFIQKPFRVQELLDRVRTALGTAAATG